MNTSMHTATATNIRPSHNISDRDDKFVTIHDLELFVGHIPGFDADDSGMEEIDEEAIEQILERTKAHMSAGSNPKLVMLHQDENSEVPPEALGDIINIHRKDIHIRTDDGEEYTGPGIIGDVVMSKDDFNSYIATNRFPRRSAEIWKDGHMSEVALLGRETPARPLRDTRFTKSGSKSTYTRPITFAEVAPGGNNTFVPTYGEDDKKENGMPEQEEMLPIEHDGADMELVDKLKAENDELRKELEQIKMQMNSEDTEQAEYNNDNDEEAADMKKYQEEEEDNDEEKEIFSKIRKTKNGKNFIDRYKRIRGQRNRYRKSARKLGIKLRRAEYSKIIDDLAAEGYRVANHRDHMLEELLSTRDLETKLKFWRSTLTRDPIGHRLNLQQTRVTGKSEYSAEDRRTANDRAVSRMTREGLSADQFHNIFEQELKTG